MIYRVPGCARLCGFLRKLGDCHSPVSVDIGFQKDIGIGIIRLLRDMYLQAGMMAVTAVQYRNDWAYLPGSYLFLEEIPVSVPVIVCPDEIKHHTQFQVADRLALARAVP